jgi:hypothetical protein
MRKITWVVLLGLWSLASVGCESSGDGRAPVAARRPSVVRNFKTDLLIFNGVATATGDPEAIAAIAEREGLSYDIVTSAEIDAMSVEGIAGYGSIVWPGGYAGQMSSSLSATGRDRIRRAVVERGVSFVGFCAGAFIAVSPGAVDGQAGPDWGLALQDAKTLPYYHLEDEGTEYAMVKAQLADGTSRQLVWWGGPFLGEVNGGVLARYNDTGQPAITQDWAGNGLMLLSGPHPEAPTDWRAKLNLSDSDGLDQDIAAGLLHAAVRAEPLPSM